MYRDYKPILHSFFRPLVVQAFCGLSFFLNNWRRLLESWKVAFRGPTHETASLAGNLGRNVHLESAPCARVWVRVPVCACVRARACVIWEGMHEAGGGGELHLCLVYLVSFHFPLRGWRGCCNFQNTAKNISTNCFACLPLYIKQHRISEGTLQRKTPFFFFFAFSVTT